MSPLGSRWVTTAAQISCVDARRRHRSTRTRASSHGPAGLACGPRLRLCHGPPSRRGAASHGGLARREPSCRRHSVLVGNDDGFALRLPPVASPRGLPPWLPPVASSCGFLPRLPPPPPAFALDFHRDLICQPGVLDRLPPLFLVCASSESLHPAYPVRPTSLHKAARPLRHRGMSRADARCTHAPPLLGSEPQPPHVCLGQSARPRPNLRLQADNQASTYNRMAGQRQAMLCHRGSVAARRLWLPAFSSWRADHSSLCTLIRAGPRRRHRAPPPTSCFSPPSWGPWDALVGPGPDTVGSPRRGQHASRACSVIRQGPGNRFVYTTAATLAETPCREI